MQLIYMPQQERLCMQVVMELLSKSFQLVQTCSLIKKSAVVDMEITSRLNMQQVFIHVMPI